jgi:hypothetical protein
MTDIVALVKSLGGLHDSTMLSLQWDPPSKRLEMRIEDIYSNFLGLPEYPGATPATFIFSGVKNLVVEVDFTEDGLWVYDCEFHHAEGSKYNCAILFSPGGKIVVACDHIECAKG